MNYKPATISIYRYVLNRLPFLADTPTNQTLVGSFIWETMVELDKCFNVNKTNTGYDPEDQSTSWIGDEDKYTELQKLIIADLASVAIIMVNLAANSAGTASGSTGGVAPTAKYMSRAKAGSVEVEWKGFDIKEGSGFYTSGTGLLEMYKTAGLRRALNLGCVIDITSDLGMQLVTMYQPVSLPFIVVDHDCGCGNLYQTASRA